MSIIYNGQADPQAFNKVLASTIDKLIEKDEKVCWLDADLSGCSATRSNYEKSNRYINCGIAESNMIGIAAGLSATGMKPYAHSFAPFVSRRVFDQVFLSCGYADNPICVVGTDPGITAAFNGGTHMPFEDVGTYRMIPNAIICDCSDTTMLEKFLTMAKDLPGVKYIRLPRKASYPIFSKDTKFEVGKAKVIKDNSDSNCLIVASGIMVHEAMQAALELEKENIKCSVIDPFTIKPLDVDLIKEYAEKIGNVVVTENHNKIGGLVSAVEDALIGMKINFAYVAIEDKYGEVGPQDYLREKFDLTSDHIIRCVKEIV